MSEPKRWREEGSEEMRALLLEGRPSRRMTAEERARTARRVARHAAAAAVAASLSWVPGAALGAGLGVATLVVAWGVPAWLAPTPVPPAPSAPAKNPAPPPAPSPSVEAPRAPPTAPAEPGPPRPAVPTPGPAPPSSDTAVAPPPAQDLLAEEVALLERARAALASSPADALALADTHAARFPAGKLGMEREMVAIDALRRLGRTGEARARAEAMLSRARGSLYEERVRKLLDGLR